MVKWRVNYFLKELVKLAITAYFVRHGQTYLNRYNRMQGWADAPLTEKGIEDAKRAGKNLAAVDFDYLFASDLPRTMATARLLLAADPNTDIQEPTPEPAFREEFFGYFEGANGAELADMLGGVEGYHTFAQMAAGWGPDELKDRIAAADKYGDAENAEQFWTRINKGFDHLRQLPDDSVVVVVSHGATIRSIVQHFSNEYDPSESPRNGSLTKLTITDSNVHVDFFNKLHVPDN